MKIKTLFISDVHLGNNKSNPKSLLKVFDKYQFEQLVIIGDLIDLTSLKRKFFWNTDHSTVVQKILKLSRNGVIINYIIGNHDYYLRSLIEDGDISIGDIILSDDMIYLSSKGEKIYICHGDQFDGFIRLHPFLYTIGDIAYEFSFKINRIYNFFRRLCKLNDWSLSSYLKSRVKNVMSFINDFEILSVKKANDMGCDSIMIGHIHTPKIIIGDTNYYNPGDFCETCSYIIETMDGKILLKYSKKD